jgi:Leucine-rich repeat (LRR) protein
MWPNHLSCFLNNLALKRTGNSKFEIQINERQKYGTKSVTFWKCQPVEFIPIEILRAFPNLNALDINGSRIPTIRESFFNSNFKMVQYLYLGRNKIKSIDEAAFSSLTELKWICLSGNEIEEIPHRIFRNNPKLEFIDLDKNKIKLLHPGLFAGLQCLSEIWLKKNPIVSADFKTSDFTLMEMSETLKPLFDNYMQKFAENSSRDHNGREKFEDLKMKMAEKDKIIENLTAKISQTNEELRKVKGVTKKLAEDRKKDTVEISLELLSNYAKLRATEGDIKFEFADGYILKGHKTILAGSFYSKLFAYQFGFYDSSNSSQYQVC